MYVVVIDRVAGDVAELARALAGVVGKTAYEVRPSVQVPEGGPAVVAVHAQLDAAEQTAAQLLAVGFECRVAPGRDPLPGRRRFGLAAAHRGLRNRSVNRSLSPMAAYRALSFSPSR